MLNNLLDDLITTEELYKKLKMKRTSFDTMRKSTDFPAPYCITGLKGYRYSQQEVIEWVKTRKKTKARALPNKTIKLQKPSKKSTLFENTSESEKNIILMLNRGKGYGIAKSA